MYDDLTQKDIKDMEAEVEHRKLVIRPKTLEDVREARAHGDLSENFEYKAAKQAQRENESRIRYLEKMIKTANIIDDSSKEGEVGLDKCVTVYIPEDDIEETYHITTTIRGNSLQNRISIDSPMGKALMGHSVGDTVTVVTDSGYSYDVEIRKIEEANEEAGLRKF
jgi:transcription elongation factor GreA